MHMEELKSALLYIQLQLPSFVKAELTEDGHFNLSAFNYYAWNMPKSGEELRKQAIPMLDNLFGALLFAIWGEDLGKSFLWEAEGRELSPREREIIHERKRLQVRNWLTEPEA